MKKKRIFEQYLAVMVLMVGDWWVSSLFAVRAENAGVSFGMGQNLTWLVLIFWLGLAIFNYFWRSWGVVLILAGGGANLMDRLMYGHVRDYWQLGSVVNNLADWLIGLGVFLVILRLWINRK